MNNSRRPGTAEQDSVKQLLVGLKMNPPIEKAKLEELKGALEKVINVDNESNRQSLDTSFRLIMVQQGPAVLSSLSKEVLISLKNGLEKMITLQNQRNFVSRKDLDLGKSADLKTSQETPTPPSLPRMTRGGG